MVDRDLKNFCREMLLALDGKVIPNWFNSGYALCNNARRYDQIYDTCLYSTLTEMFDGDPYPFNNSDGADYRHERWHGFLYKNEERIAFLKKYAEFA